MGEAALTDALAVALAARLRHPRGGAGSAAVSGAALPKSQSGRVLRGLNLRRFGAIFRSKALAVTENHVPAAKRRRRLDELVAKARVDEIVPAIRWTGVLGLIAGDDEALGGAGHGDIKQAPMFGLGGRARLGPRVGDRLGVQLEDFVQA